MTMEGEKNAGTFVCVGFSLPPCGVCLLCGTAGAVDSFSNKPLSTKMTPALALAPKFWGHNQRTTVRVVTQALSEE